MGFDALMARAALLLANTSQEHPLHLLHPLHPSRPSRPSQPSQEHALNLLLDSPGLLKARVQASDCDGAKGKKGGGSSASNPAAGVTPGNSEADVTLEPDAFEKRAFQELDADGDGFVTVEELHRSGLLPAGTDVAALITEADVDGDGRVDIHEYVRMMRRCLHVTGM